MARVVRTEVTVTSTVPVEIRFKCAKCGKEVHGNRVLRHQTTGSAAGKNTGRAESNALTLHGSAAWRLAGDVLDLERNTARLTDGTGRVPPLRCDACGFINLPDAGCKRRWLFPNGLKWPMLVLLVIAGTAAFMAIGGSLLYLSGKERLFFLYVLLGCLAMGVPLLQYDWKLSRRAYDNPALMERAFKSVLNDAVYADMTPYGLGMVHVGCIGESMSVQDQLARQEAIEKSLIGEADSEAEA